eukprot:COSAG01_NODE_126_length_24988_cov_7.711511_6_plen_109_part_00
MTAAFSVLQGKCETQITWAMGTQYKWLGDFEEDRKSRVQREDALSILEAMVLSTEAYGVEAQEHIADKLKYAKACFHHSKKTMNSVRLGLVKLQLDYDSLALLAHHAT